MLMKTGILWREPKTMQGHSCPCCSRKLQAEHSDVEGFSAADDHSFAVPPLASAAVWEVDEIVFEPLKGQLGEAAPALCTEAAAEDDSAAVRRTAGSISGESRVVAYCMLGDSCLAALHKNGRLCIIRRKEPVSNERSRLLCGSTQLSTLHCQRHTHHVHPSWASS
ncbi:hypothetical protein, conserved [Eimeria tenella]|uniref:Uncharacterized protein n=1 Tax=Eimeria tenella TaxID=5802 RepID=U6L4V6_EIMTE|nr:hypothetical protein, conserved [Eimeria tenella]CDJ42810.1 hypothetical protein, conserved [Eimeria tenella]|eukprot:XP_013233560.1 hypothetical protein, conserved [Eimeria tenella]